MLSLSTSSAPTVPEPAPIAADQLAGLSDDQRITVDLWMTEIARLRDTPKARQAEYREAMLKRLGVAKSVYYERRKKYDATGDVKAFLDNRHGTAAITGTLVDFFQQLCEEQGRSSRQAINALHRLWRAGEHIPGFGTWQEYWRKRKGAAPLPDRCDFLPRGLTDSNLYKHMPNKFALTAAREGRGAASKFRMQTMSTRVGLYVASHIAFDDKWEDCLVTVKGVNKRAQRPLELGALDIFTDHKFCWDAWPMLEQEDGSRTILGGSHMRMLVAAVLFVHGFNRRGTVFIVERGTASISPDLEDLLRGLTNGAVTVHRGKVLGQPAMTGHYHGAKKGNSRHNAVMESSHNPHHNRMADMLLNPGQIGRNRNKRPEEMHGREAYSNHLLKVAEELAPEIAAKLRFPILPWHLWRHLAQQVYLELAMDTNHEIEGWEACNHVVQEMRIALDYPWQPMSQFASLPAPQQAALAAVAAMPEMTRIRRMSRLEAWQQGCGQLTKIDMAAVWLILNQDSRICRVTQTKELQYKDISGEHRFIGPVKTPNGQCVELKRGAEYRLVVNSFAPTKALVGDLKGRLIGVVDARERVSRLDMEGIHRQQGMAAAAEADELADLERRHWDQAEAKAAMEQHNKRVLAGQPTTPAERAKAKANKALANAVTPSEMLSALTPDAEPEPEDDADFASLLGTESED